MESNDAELLLSAYGTTLAPFPRPGSVSEDPGPRHRSRRYARTPRWHALKHDDQDHAARAGLVGGVLAPIDLVGACPESGALLALSHPGAHGDPLAPHLDFHVGPGGEVVEPPRVLGRATLRCDHHVRVAVAHVQQRGGAGLLGPAPNGAQEQHRPATEARADVAVLVEPLVHGEHRAFDEWVHLGHHTSGRPGRRLARNPVGR